MSAIAKRLYERYRSSDRAHGQYIPEKEKRPGHKKLEGKATTVNEPIQLELFEQHLKGEYGIGGIPIRDGNVCRWGAIDLDIYQGFDWAQLERDLAELLLPLIPCKTKSGGCHLYLFLSEDCPAALVRKRLVSWASALGHPGAEVFPKQVALVDDDDKGNWINLPYYGGDETTRYAISNGERVSLEKFLHIADESAMSREELETFRLPATEESDLLHEAPPCLQCLAKQGCGEGNRNKFAFNLGVYARNRFGDDYAEKLDAFNQQLMQPPMDHKEVAQITRNVGKKDYAYTCKEDPIKSVCDRATCLTRKYGVGGGITSDAKDVVAELNKRYALVLVGDKSAILQKGTDAEGRPEVRLLTLGAFKEWHRPHRVSMGNRTVSRAEFWLSDPGRKQYEGLVFAPGRKVEQHYNLWRGLAVEPNPDGDCSLFLEHLRNNVCQGREDLYQYLVGWLAQLIQEPASKVGTSLVLRGRQGVGKTIVGKTMGVILGDHYALVSDPRYITGRFNAHLTSTLLLHADEGFWAGDRAAEGKLKDLITGDYQWIEFKGKEAIRVRNYLRLLVTGNAEWIIPAGLEERRFAVLDVGTKHMQDHAYFGAIEDQLLAGGYGALLHHLQTLDVSQVNLRRIPETGALFEQKMASLSPEEGWLLDILTNGKLPGDMKGEGRAPAPLLYDHYIRHAQRVGIKRRSIESQVGRFLRKHFPKLKKHEGTYSDPATAETRRCYVFQFPPLAKCRATLAKAIRHPGDWEPPNEWARGDLI